MTLLKASTNVPIIVSSSSIEVIHTLPFQYLLLHRHTAFLVFIRRAPDFAQIYGTTVSSCNLAGQAVFLML